MRENPRRVGLWLIGARGSIGTATIASHWLLCNHQTPTTGLVTDLPAFRALDLLSWDEIVIGGCDIATAPLSLQIERHIREGILPRGFPAVPADVLDAIEQRVCDVSPLVPSGRNGSSAAKTLQALREKIRDFRRDAGVERVIVVNCSSTQAVSRDEEALSKTSTWDEMSRRLTRIRIAPWNVLYAAAALEEGCAYINFTPNAGTDLPALAELAKMRGVPHAGRDGKTGETLVKSILAPLFAARAMRVVTWQGYNMLGNADGASLSHPEARAVKVKSKDQQLRAILGNPEDLHTHVGIDYVPSLGDWKTAWDFIHFEGFLGVRMAMQFTWQGCDTALATPLVLDLVRLVELAWLRGESGELGYLCSFFKSPIGCREHDFRRQIDHLYRHLELTPVPS